MKLLCIDTSTKSFSLAVSDDLKILAAQEVILKNVLSDSIVPSINAILKKAKVKLNGIDGFVIGLGPGSFTRLRVGLSTVKGLAFALQKPVVGISTLDVIALNVKERDRPIVVINDARRGLIYASIYEWKKDRLIKKMDDGLIELKKIMKKIPAQSIFIGDGVPLYQKELEKHIKAARFMDEQFQYPQAKNMVPCAIERFKEKRTDDINKLVPIYLYPDDCQVTKK